jgi:hypothetical protein
MAVILFVDMLGARKKWQTGGVQAAVEAFDHFARMVIAAVRAEDPKSVIRGGIETDSAMLVFEGAVPAFAVAKRLYHYAFTNRRNPNAPRLWLRGSMVRDGDDIFLRRSSRMGAQFDNVEVFTYSPPALDAISIEKSGFKGMRLLVKTDLVTDAVKSAFRIPFGEMFFTPFKRLRYSGYPAGKDDLVDFLWMACKDDAEWEDISLHMTYRFRHSSRDADEFAQAAATQVMFHECGALRTNAVGRGIRIQKEKSHEGADTSSGSMTGATPKA